ncbi:SPOR domain-containing protein [Phaeobacter gallaeciensis]|uniref:SPOR domain-containing protein n=2 Tax=Roseobacteraceae TaxID=2854170 RepID=A0A366WQA5_9RHOB|nr:MULTISPECIES: SPOR domain-containing protein [Roseobacteraceae]MBT3143091.1 SPOR domain-containing protein [Falsiruegeria litorea]MBT8166805.1 SPOR domain-containing protein [Falsiruegeria litorea]RBW51616.1 SPOR domain-containing protein [Phaeobacter gallaeciensis]
MIREAAKTRFSPRLAAITVALTFLAACEDGAKLPFKQPKDSSEPTQSQSTKLVERDVEAPEVFQVTESGLWDGRPSLGGVWVAHPDATDPERVIIRNSANGKFVIGALFRRERDIPGPRIQASSDAASALGMLPGAPVELNVTALRREAVDEEPEIQDTLIPSEAIEPGGEITEAPLDPIAGGAAAAIAASTPAAPTAPTEQAAEPAPTKTSSLSKPYVQIGIFSVEANANRTADQMRSAGMTPTVFEQSANGKPFWRVVVGPAQSKSERSTLLKKVKATGFSDAYAVSK